MGYVIRPADWDDARVIGSRLRGSDREEMAAVFGPSFDGVALVEDALRRTRTGRAPAARVIADDRTDEPVCIFGAADDPVDPEKGVVWLLATDQFRAVPPRLGARACQNYVLEALEAPYSRLHNYVRARNSVSVRWLAHIGFTVGGLVRYGVMQDLFHYFFVDPLCAIPPSL